MYNTIYKFLFISTALLFSASTMAKQATSGYLGLELGKLTAPVRAHIPDSIAKNTTKTQGLIVVGLADISPAADDGIKLYDVLLSYDKEPIEDPQAFIDKVRQDKPGRITYIQLMRQGEILNLPITLGEQLKVVQVAPTTFNNQPTQRQNFQPMLYPSRPANQLPPYITANPYQKNIRPPSFQQAPVARPLNITGKPAYPMRKKPKVHAWGKERNIWTDFYTGATNDFWDKMINAPHDIGRMPGGWRAPALSTPDPVTVGDAVTNQMPPFVEEMGNMMDISD